MERYIDILKSKSQGQPATVVPEIKPAEKITSVNPCVLTMVTLGKELHAGHLFLLSAADQIRAGLGGQYPLVLINNNTGPRAAAALCRVAADWNLDLAAAADLLNRGRIPLPQLVAAYRSRDETDSQLPEAIGLLATEGLDIFAGNTEKAAFILGRAGFSVQIISQSRLLAQGLDSLDGLSPSWSGTGFTPVTSDKRTVVIQKSGELTASGSVYVALSALSRQVQPDLFLVVDSQADVADVAFAYSVSSRPGAVAHLSGAGIGLGGKIASGTGGEALAIGEVLSEFQKIRPGANLRQAAAFFTLTRPVSLPNKTSATLAEGFYDFADNSALLKALVAASDRAENYQSQIQQAQADLMGKISQVSTASNRYAGQLLQFLPQRSQALFSPSPTEIIATARKVDVVSDPAQVAEFMAELGYEPETPNSYTSRQRVLGIRKNYYFNKLNSLLQSPPDISAITPGDCATLNQMIQFCQSRLGL